MYIHEIQSPILDQIYGVLKLELFKSKLLWREVDEFVGWGRNSFGVDGRPGHVCGEGGKRYITTCSVVSEAPAAEFVKAYDAGQIQVLYRQLLLSLGLWERNLLLMDLSTWTFISAAAPNFMLSWSMVGNYNRFWRDWTLCVSGLACTSAAQDLGAYIIWWSLLIWTMFARVGNALAFQVLAYIATLQGTVCIQTQRPWSGLMCFRREIMGASSNSLEKFFSSDYVIYVPLKTWFWIGEWTDFCGCRCMKF